MKCSQRTLLSAVLVLTGLSPVLADGSAQETWAGCRVSNSCAIEYDHLSKQDTDPFLFIGKVVDREHPRWRTYRNSLRRYPDVRDCLVKEEQAADTPNLLRIDWERIGTGEHASVCVFRIASSLGSVERIIQWLEYHEFRHRGLNNYRGDNFEPLYQSEPVSQITARWTTDQYRRLNPSWFASLTGYDFAYEYRIILSFDQNQNIAEVGVSAPTKLN